MHEFRYLGFLLDNAARLYAKRQQERLRSLYLQTIHLERSLTRGERQRARIAPELRINKR